MERYYEGQEVREVGSGEGSLKIVSIGRLETRKIFCYGGQLGRFRSLEK